MRYPYDCNSVFSLRTGTEFLGFLDRTNECLFKHLDYSSINSYNPYHYHHSLFVDKLSISFSKLAFEYELPSFHQSMEGINIETQVRNNTMYTYKSHTGMTLLLIKNAEYMGSKIRNVYINIDKKLQKNIFEQNLSDFSKELDGECLGFLLPLQNANTYLTSALDSSSLTFSLMASTMNSERLRYARSCLFLMSSSTLFKRESGIFTVVYVVVMYSNYEKLSIILWSNVDVMHSNNYKGGKY